MKKFVFEVLLKSKKGRRGKITTAHGTIETPAFVPVATKGTLKGLTPQQAAEIPIQLSFVNSYHLALSPGMATVEKLGGVHAMSGLTYPLMCDSGGFQIFSLGRADSKQKARVRGEEEPFIVKKTDEEVIFRSPYNGETITFNPKTSIAFQRIIGADIFMAFDECIYAYAPHKYAHEATKRTHRWLTQCISEHKKDNPRNQALYGVIQGGMHEDLRIASAQFVAEQNVQGVAIGGVSVGETKKEMREQIGYVAPYLPSDKPVHLLGVGQIDDIVDLVQWGIDTFDCVEPTRLARTGVLYSTQAVFKRSDSYTFDIVKNKYAADTSTVDKLCSCYTCSHFSKAYIHHLFKQRELLGYTLATIHNLSVMEALMKKIRSELQ
ncbi:MAG: tRNA guanosine(34) transglycosylase Tgt [Candidatus Roizmanbacteria bacterium]|nr:tRNA guanosine(34) transglycosylase Tgt [Candidatus Roizmanbacteria bacterium]